MEELSKWSDYDFNCQIYDGDFNIYVSKNDIEVFSTGGYSSFEGVKNVVIEWLKRVNKKNQN